MHVLNNIALIRHQIKVSNIQALEAERLTK